MEAIRRAPGCADGLRGAQYKLLFETRQAGQVRAAELARGDPGVSQREGITLVHDHPRVKAKALGSLEQLQAISQC